MSTKPPKRKKLSSIKEVKRQARNAIGMPPTTRVVGDKKKKPYWRRKVTKEELLLREIFDE